MSSIFYIFLIFALSHCSTKNQRAQQLSAIKMGMVKSEVLNVAGPPHWSDRHVGMDRWIYYLQPEQKQTEHVIYFKKGQVVRKGERIQPLLTAEEAERLKQPRSKKQPVFKPRFNEKQLRKLIKKEVEKSQKKEPPSQMEEI